MKKVNFNMRKVIAIAISLAAVTMFSACDPDDPKDDLNNNNGNENTNDFVEINGVKWATRNIDMPGTFTANPEDTGQYYQWNRGKALSTAGDGTNWDETIEGSEWEKANDPSPAGYHIPSSLDIWKLIDRSKVTDEWTVQNGVYGRKFTDIETGNSIFLPATGYCASGKLVLGTFGEDGQYWSSTAYDNSNAYIDPNAYYLHFSEYDDATSRGYTKRSQGFSIRCVKD